ncbi:MAG: DUF111 family protein, partial [Rubrobacter sp.]|nr:DUF111 family protein [Rubrobacter sp.]
MTLAALIAAGASLAKVSCALSNLNVSFELHTGATEVSGIQALRVEVEYPEQHVHRTFAGIRRLIEEAG